MKTRIASSIALAATIVLGATGCGLMAPQATTDAYSPSDGIDVNVGDVDVRNLMLIAGEGDEYFNVVFTGVNAGASPAQLGIGFVDAAGAEAGRADFSVDPGTTLFGDPEDTEPGRVALVPIPELAPGATVDAYLHVDGGQDVRRQIPVLDGTLAEYRRFVTTPEDLPSQNFQSATEGDAKVD